MTEGTEVEGTSRAESRNSNMMTIMRTKMMMTIVSIMGHDDDVTTATYMLPGCVLRSGN